MRLAARLLRPAALPLAFVLGGVLASGCAPPEPPEPEPLVYRAPDPPVVRYVSVDTMEASIRSPVGDMEVGGASTTTYRAEFTPGADGLGVEMRVEELDGRVSNPFVGSVEFDESSMRGSLVFRLGPRGEVEVLETPEVEGPQAGGLLDRSEVVHTLFPALPRQTPTPGTSWTDTIRRSGPEQGFDVEATTVTTYTLVRTDAGPAGDLLEVRAEGTTRTSLSGEAEGMEMLRTMEGTEEGTLLLDASTALPVSADWRRTYSGTIEIPAAGMEGLALTVTGRSVVRRAEAPQEVP